MSDDLTDLYQEIILSHNKRPRNECFLEPYDGRAEGYNPLCGDKVTVFVRLNGAESILSEVSFVGEGCAISRASASIMTTQIKGLPLAEIIERIDLVTAMLSQADEPTVDLASDGDLAALAGVRRFPARIKCATLSWHALKEAIENAK